MERFRKNPFRARKVNQHIINSQGDIGVPKTRPKELTTPKSPNMSVNSRSRASSLQTPTFSSTKKRINLSSTKKDGKTIMAPFNLRTEIRGSATKARIEDIKKKEYEEAKRQSSSFKANKIMTFDQYSSSTPRREPTKLTDPVPFNLASEHLHEASQAQLRAKIEQEERERVLQMSGKKAKAVPSTTYESNFTPKQPSKNGRAPLTGVSPVLVTRSQAKNREEFDRANKERIESIKQDETRIKLRRDNEENEEIKQLRKLPSSEGGLMQVAKPIDTTDHYPTNKVEEKILTEPEFSPSELRTSLRAIR